MIQSELNNQINELELHSENINNTKIEYESDISIKSKIRFKILNHY